MSPEATEYDLRLSLTAEYDAPSDKVRLLTHLLPRVLNGRQSLKNMYLKVKPAPDEQRNFTDFFGNTATMIAFHAPVSGVQIDLRGRVACRARTGRLDLSPQLPELAVELAAQRSLHREAPHHFVAPSARVPAVPEIAAFAEGLALPGQTALGVTQALCARLHEDIAFQAGETDVDTPIAEAFARRTGVCQDISHIMICGLRAVGIPAGYVSGLLRTEPPPGQPRLEGADAMHAWVRAWCGSEHGWVEFDPTNNCRAGDDHVVVAYGRDYADVAPIQGVMVTAGTQSSHHSVDLVPVSPG
jgi:transglutaminase-like putative cysteine protease